MKTIAELYGEEPTPKRQNPLRRRRTIADLYGETSDEPDTQPETTSDGDSSLDAITRLLRPGGVAVELAKSPLGEFLFGAVAETAGNALETLGDPNKTLAARYSPWMQNLKGAGETLNEEADSLLENASKHVTVDDYDTFIGAGKNAFGSQGYGSLGGLMSMIHSDKAANALMNASAALENRNRVSTDDGYLEYFTNPRGFWSDTAGLAGSMATIAPTMFLFPEATIARGIYGLGGSVLERFLINRGLIGSAKFLAQSAPNIARYTLTSAPTEAAMEGGQARYDALRQGLSPEEADRRAREVFKYNLPLLGGSNLLEAANLFAPLRRVGKIGKALQIGGRMGFGSGQQQGEEAYQQAIQDYAAGKDFGILPWNWTDEQKEAAERVRYPGALMGLLGGGFQALSEDEMSDDEYTARADKTLEERIRRDTRGAITRHDYADLKALRSWADKHSGGQMSDEVFGTIVRVAQQEGVPVDRLLAQAIKESQGDQRAISPVGAIGVMQLMPKTAQELGVDPHDTEQNIIGGARYLKQQYEATGDWDLAHAAYNAGLGNVQEYKGIPPFAETQNYVSRINEYLSDRPDVGNISRYMPEDKDVHYLGSNGAGEGKTWIRQTDAVSFDNAQPQLLNAVDILADWFYKRTGKRLVVTSGTNGSHADGEHSHAAGWKVDVNDWENGTSDGYLVRAEGGKGSLTDEFIAFGRSLGLGMNWEDDHIDVALDGTQWDGNGDNAGGFNPRPPTTSKRTTASSDTQTPKSNETPPIEPPESPKPIFDINAEDEKLFERFANEKYNPPNGNADQTDLDFFSSMFDGDKFINTQENRDEIQSFYGKDFTDWAQNILEQESPAPEIQPTQSTPKPKSATQSPPQIQSTQSQPTAQTPTKIRGTNGNSAQVLTDNRNRYGVRYKVVEADDLNVSHDLNPVTNSVEVNKNYPAELQPRDRERAGYRDRVLNMGANLDPTQLMDSENVNQGAPIIRSDGVVLNGNGRTMAIRRAQKTGRADAYRNSILENAERLGLNKDEISAMKNPVLVREVTDDLSGDALTNITQSRQGGMQLGAVEQAREDAKKLTSQILSHAPDDGDLSKAGSRDFLIAAIRAISNPEELNAMTTADGGITDAGVRRVRNALFAAAFGENQTLANLAETSETEGNAVKGATNALTATAAKFARIRAESEKGNLPKVDLSPIIQAVEKLAALREQGTPVLKHLTQRTLPGFETESEEVKDLLGFFDGHKRRPQEITNFMHKLADGILSNASNSGDIFGGAPKNISLAKALANARQQIEGDDLTRAHLRHEPTFKAVSSRIHKRLQTHKDKILKGVVNNLLENARDGDEESLRILNRLKGDPTETNIFDTTEENSNPQVETDDAPETKSESNEKLSRVGDKGTLENILSDDELTSTQKAIRDFCAKMGVPVKFFDSHSDAQGAFRDGVAYINVNSKATPEWVFHHEIGHWLAVNEPQLFNQLVKLLNITDEQRQAYRDKFKRRDLTDDEIDAEILCDMFGDEAKRLGLFKDANKKNPSLVERLISWLKNTLDKFVDFMFKSENGLTRSQRNRLYDSVGKLANAIVDAHGNKKYRYNRETHTLEYVDGTPIETLPLTKANEKSGTKWSRAESQDSANDSEPEQVDENNPKTWRDTAPGKFFMKAVDKFKRALHLKGDRIISSEDQRQAKKAAAKSALAAYVKNPSKENLKRLHELGLGKQHVKDYLNDNLFDDGIGIFKNWIPSPSRIADKVQVFRSFFRMGNRALRKQIQSRGKYVRRYNRIMDIVAKKDDRDNLFGLLWKGDFTGQEFGKLSDKELDAAKTSRRNGESETQAIQRAKIEKICREQDVSENVARAYLEVRKMLRALGIEINKARRHPQNQSRFLSDAEIEDLKGNKFVEIKQIGDKRDEAGKRLVRYTEFENRERTLLLTPKEVAALEKDDAIQILDQSGFNGGKALVRFREGIPEMTTEKGYIPHFFHEYSVEVRDKSGKKIGHTLFTAQTEREAVKLAEKWKESNTLKDGENLYITPRGLARELGLDAEKLAPVIGDNDFAKMTERIAKLHDMTLEEAKKFLEDTTQFKTRHRFLGNLIDRKGAEGFEQNMDWVLRHYINVGTRYVAMESEFLPQAITQFEKLFGAFDNDYSRNLTAQYVKEYIQDVNGNPTRVEEFMNKTFNKAKLYREFVTATYGNRGWLTATDATIRFVSYAKLGFFNLSSAMLNLTQLINAGGLLGGYKRLGKHFGKIVAQGGKLTQKQLRILTESGVINDLGLDTNSAYDKHRVSLFGDASTFDKVDNALNKSMVIFQTMDTLCRAATTLAAYEQATSQGKSKSDALEYAADINRKANFDYSVTDAPNLFRRFGPIGKLVLQFQKYPVKQLELLWDMHPLNNKTSRAQKIAFWAPYILACGLMGFMPFFDWGDKLANQVGFFPKDFLEESVIKISQGIFGEGTTAAKEFSRAWLYGGGALANVDMSSRAGLAGFLDNDLKGATLSTIFNTAGHFWDGEYSHALRDVSPGLYNYYAAYEGETHGRRGRTNDVYDFWGRLRRAFGFRSADEASIVDAERIERNRQSQRYDKEHKAIDAYIDDPSAENLERLRELRISPRRVNDERHKKKLTREGRFWDNIPKKHRPDYQYLEDFVDDD